MEHDNLRLGTIINQADVSLAITEQGAVIVRGNERLTFPTVEMFMEFVNSVSVITVRLVERIAELERKENDPNASTQ